MVKKIVDAINKEFGVVTGFPKNFVKARTNTDGDFILRIGGRDIQLDSTGKFIGAGTDLELNDKYSVNINN